MDTKAKNKEKCRICGKEFCKDEIIRITAHGVECKGTKNCIALFLEKKGVRMSFIQPDGLSEIVCILLSVKRRGKSNKGAANDNRKIGRNFGGNYCQTNAKTTKEVIRIDHLQRWSFLLLVLLGIDIVYKLVYTFNSSGNKFTGDRKMRQVTHSQHQEDYHSGYQAGKDALDKVGFEGARNWLNAKYPTDRKVTSLKDYYYASGYMDALVA